MLHLDACRGIYNFYTLELKVSILAIPISEEQFWGKSLFQGVFREGFHCSFSSSRTTQTCWRGT